MLELIDRQLTLKKMCETCGYCERFEKAMRSTHPDFVTEKCNTYKFLAEQPSIKAKPVRYGHWIPVDGEPYAKCSYCGEKHYGCSTPYCDMCGSYMREEIEDVGTD